MGLRINTSVESLIAQRYLNTNKFNFQRSLERLSSGLKINRAADDAAGMAISQKLRTQVQGLSQANRNAQDAINLISTAEGGLNNITDILNRVRELGIQAANDTVTQNDRQKIEIEMNQLLDELDRVADTTQFNNKTLLDGTFSSSRGFEDGYVELIRTDTIGTVPNTDFVKFVAPDEIIAINEVIDLVTSISADHFIQEYRLVVDDSFPPNAFYGDKEVFLETIISDDEPVQSIAGGISVLRPFFDAVTIIVMNNGETLGGIELNLVDITLTDTGKSAALKFGRPMDVVTIDNSLVFHVGANQGQTFQVGIGDVSRDGLGLKAMRMFDPTNPDNETATRVLVDNVIQATSNALDRVSTLRAELGAVQNRLEQTIQHLSISEESTSRSLSRIMDTDFAEETSLLTKSQILVQAGTAILSNANFTNQSVLALL